MSDNKTCPNSDLLESGVIEYPEQQEAVEETIEEATVETPEKTVREPTEAIEIEEKELDVDALKSEYEELIGKKPHANTKAETLKKAIDAIKEAE